MCCRCHWQGERAASEAMQTKMLYSHMSIHRFIAIKMKLNTIHPYIETTKKEKRSNKSKAKQEKQNESISIECVCICCTSGGIVARFPFDSFAVCSLLVFCYSTLSLSLSLCLPHLDVPCAVVSWVNAARMWCAKDERKNKQQLALAHMSVSQEMCLLAINAVSTIVFEPHKQNVHMHMCPCPCLCLCAILVFKIPFTECLFPLNSVQRPPPSLPFSQEFSSLKLHFVCFFGNANIM